MVKFFDYVQTDIPLVEERMREQSNGHHPELAQALNHLLSAGGKRLRPATCLLVGRMLKADPDRMITLAAAVELLHTATLVHDDVIDGSLLRRGNPTLNAKWSPGATILTGDFLFARAAKLAAETESIELMKVFSKTLAVIVNGELTQLFTSKGLVNREDYFSRIYAKTASLFELSAYSPAYLAGSDEEMLNELRSYGYEIGMAFQIMDDILDFTSDQSELGKPVASDLRQGLVTLPAIIYIENHPDDADMQQVLREKKLAPEETIKRLVDSIRASGAIEAALEEARAFVNRGLAALDRMPDYPEKVALEELAMFVINRQL